MHDLEAWDHISVFQTLCWASTLPCVVLFYRVYIMHLLVLTKLQDGIQILQSARQCSQALESESHWAEFHLLIFCCLSSHSPSPCTHAQAYTAVWYHVLRTNHFCRFWPVALPSARECSRALESESSGSLLFCHHACVSITISSLPVHMHMYTLF